MTKHRILGACNPRFAYGALKMEDKLGILLLCNVIVRETPDGRVEVAGVYPVAAMQRTGNRALQPTAEEVRRLLTVPFCMSDRRQSCIHIRILISQSLPRKTQTW
jgi:uncharacterized protein (DUF302 family)